MSDPFLILHKVRGEPAFDIATKIDCPTCHGDHEAYECNECTDGFWWIIPTSGHRAHPYWHVPLYGLCYDLDVIQLAYNNFNWKDVADTPPMPPGWPDHYPSRAAPSIDIRSVISALAPKMDVDRRF